MKDIKFKLLVFTFCLVLGIFSCNKSNQVKIIDDAKVYDFGYFNNSEIIIPKNQTNGQSLSIVIKCNNGELIVFDGGRIEDADYLCDLIKKYGGKVTAWFLTHIHDDHIGALYNILSEKRKDIYIKNLYYNFADFEWYHEKIGDDAGVLLLFNSALDNYGEISVHNDIMKDDTFNFENVEVAVLNDLYKIDSDPINNSSIAYMVSIDKHKMIIFGDLGFKGGEELFYDLNDYKMLNADILVLSHHGQNGVPVSLYQLVKPKIVIWPTSKDIYENKNGKYDTETTKNLIDDLNPKLQVLSYENTSIIK